MKNKIKPKKMNSITILKQPLFQGLSGFGAGLLGIVTTPFRIFQSIQDLKQAEQKKDREGLLDACIILSQQPLSFCNAIGSLLVETTAIGSYFNLFEPLRFITPLTQTVYGLGLVLSIGEIFYEVIGLKRIATFSTEFIHSKPPVSQQRKQVIQWAKKTEKQAKRLLLRNQHRQDFQQIQIQCQKLIIQASIPESQAIIQAIDALYKKLLIADLKTLNCNYIQCQNSEKQTEKLIRRLGINFVQNINKSLPRLIASLVSPPLEAEQIISAVENSESIQYPPSYNTLENFKQAEQILNLMDIQINKQIIGHLMCITGCMILLTGLVLALSISCPIIPAVLIFAGSLLEIIHYLFIAGYSNSIGWSCELDKWADFKIQSMSDTLHAWRVELNKHLHLKMRSIWNPVLNCMHSSRNPASIPS